MFVDSHCHLHDFENPAETASNAGKAGVGKIVSCSVDLNSMKKSIFLQKIGGTMLCFGIHPANCLFLPQKEIAEAFEFMESNPKNFAGVGETGLDFKYAQTPEQKQTQTFLFSKHIDFSLEKKLPIVVHSRMARQECVDLLVEKNCSNVLLHWFSCGPKLLELVLEKNFYISVGPSILFRDFSRDFVKKIPLENLLLETDAPVKFSGANSLPEWIPKIAEKTAELKETSVSEIESQTFKNAKKLFKF